MVDDPFDPWLEPDMRASRRTELWNETFRAIEFAFVPFALWWLPYQNLPAPGWAVAFIAGAAAAMSVHDDMKSWQRALWLIIIGVFLITELRAISKDRSIAATQAITDRQAQDDAFQRVLNEQAKDFEATVGALNATAQGLRDTSDGLKETSGTLQKSYKQSQVQFKTTMARSDKILSQVNESLLYSTGADSFFYFDILDIRAESTDWMVVSVFPRVLGNHPVHDIWINGLILPDNNGRSMSPHTLDLGTMNPSETGRSRPMPNLYFRRDAKKFLTSFSINASNGSFTQQILIKNTGSGMYVWASRLLRNGPTLDIVHTWKDPNFPAADLQGTWSSD